MTTKLPFKRCDSCELGGGCDRMGFCGRPRTELYWRKRVEASLAVVNVATKNLHEDFAGWVAARELERLK